jgi:hypothetical protein
LVIFGCWLLAVSYRLSALFGRMPIADCRQPIASTNVILQDFLAKNLQINIIRNSFDALGVLKSDGVLIKSVRQKNNTKFH